MKPFFIFAFTAFVLLSTPAFAGCANPTANEGDMIYNKDFNVVQFCGSNNVWQRLGGSAADNRIGILTANKWCAVNAGGTAIDCTQNAPTSTSAAGASGQVQFNGTSNAFAADSNLFWDNTNKRLGINAPLPKETMQIGPTFSVYGTSVDTALRYNAYWNGTTWAYLTDTNKASQVFFDSSGLHFFTSNTAGTANGAISDFSEKLTVISNGNVGIGTSAPGGKLDVAGSLGTTSISSDGAALSFSRNGDNYVAALGGASSNLNLSATSLLLLNTGGSERMRITNTGNVGIGTAAPVEKLEVSGTVKATTFSGLAGSFARITAQAFASNVGWTYSSWVSCPTGYTLINWGLVNFFSSAAYQSTPGPSYAQCAPSGNSIRAAHYSSMVNANFLTECFGLCAKN
jgi:hypothetical protein